MDGTDPRTGEPPGESAPAAAAGGDAPAAESAESSADTAPEAADTAPDTAGDAPEATDTAPQDLTARHRAVLAMERRGWPSPGDKERAVREQLGLAPVRYYQLLNALLDDPRALAHDPVTVNRLRRVREARRAAR